MMVVTFFLLDNVSYSLNTHYLKVNPTNFNWACLQVIICRFSAFSHYERVHSPAVSQATYSRRSSASPQVHSATTEAWLSVQDSQWWISQPTIVSRSPKFCTCNIICKNTVHKHKHCTQYASTVRIQPTCQALQYAFIWHKIEFEKCK